MRVLLVLIPYLCIPRPFFTVKKTCLHLWISFESRTPQLAPRPASMVSSAGDPSNTVSFAAYHVLQIDGYSKTFEAFSNVHSINSRPFSVGGYTWHLQFFPKGDRPDNTDSMSFILLLDADNIDDEAVRVTTAEATLSLLDQDQKPVPYYSSTTGMVRLSKIVPGGGVGFEDFLEKEELEQSQVLNDDCFAVRVDIRIVKEEAVPSMAAVVPPSDMHQHLFDLLSSKEGADVELQAGGETFAAHRLLLGARSSVFREELFVPTPQKIIQIDDMEAPVFRAMLTFIYTDAWPADMDRQDGFGMTQRLLAAADRYNIHRLKLMCEDRLCNHIDTGSVANILALAEKHHCAGLKNACFQFLVGSSTALFAVIGTKEFARLARSCPAITKELISNVAARCREKGKIVGWNPEIPEIQYWFPI